MLQAATHGTQAESDPLREHIAQAHDPRAAIQRNDVDVDAVGALEICGGEQVRHELLYVHAVGTRHQH